MIIIPAIDLLDGKCVRLYRGDYNMADTVAADPVEQAKRFIDDGATRLHAVDLDGARYGTQRNFPILEKLASLPIKIETGGGIRSMERIESCFSAGVQDVIIGSAAVTDKEFLLAALRAYPDRIIAGVDAADGIVKISGWLSDSGLDYIEFSKELVRIGIKKIIFTDISRDGTLSGVNLAELAALKTAVDCDIIASGGIRDINDIDALSKLGVYGAICGKSIYSGRLSLKEAIERSKCYPKE